MAAAPADYCRLIICGPVSTSVGILLTTSENLRVENVTVLGFGTCYESGFDQNMPPKPASRLIVDRLYGDCDTGINASQSPTESHMSNFVISPFLNRGNNTASQQIMKVDSITADGATGTPMYRAFVEVGTGTGAFAFHENDTVWIATTARVGTSGTGRESAAGRWTVTNLQNVPFDAINCFAGTGMACQSFTLKSSVINGYQPDPDSRYNSSVSPLTLNGNVSNVTSNGVPPNAITGISTSPTSPDQPTLQLVAVGQTVSSSCFPGGTTVTDVWPAQGIIYVSKPSTCTPMSSIGIGFYDAPFTYTSTTICGYAPGDDADQGCASVVATERFGDGIVVSNTGGLKVTNCQTFAHLTSFHFSTDANSDHFTNCGTGEDNPLPDQDIIGLKIDGDHSGSNSDSCGNGFVSGVLGQHRTVGIVVQSNCNKPNHLSNLIFSGHSGGRRNAIGLELDAGNVGLTNSDASGNDNVFMADATKLYYQNSDGSWSYVTPTASLSIGNNQFPNATLYMSDTEAAGATVGCGNTFAMPTPYLCAPGTFVQPPGGRLTLTQGQPVMVGDVVNSGTVYYAPYTGQQIPIYNSQAGTFGLVDMGSAGLSLSLHVVQETVGKLYDIFAETIGGSVELCAGDTWSGSTSARAVSLTQIGGIYVNAADVATCYTTASSVVRDCPPSACTYLGTMFMTLAGRTSQQFGPNPHAGGNSNCLCLYNAYNQVAITSESLDTHGSYSYTSSTWVPLYNTTIGSITGNGISVVDGLGQMYISAKLVDALQQNGLNPAIGIDLNSTSAPPTLIVQSNSTSQGSYSATFNHPPVQGLWNVQPMQAALGSGSGSGTFGGSGYQDTSVQVRD